MSPAQIFLRPQARKELQSASDWYKKRSLSLARRFREAVYEALEGLAEQPESAPIIHGKIRRKLTRGFPYAIFHAVEPRGVIFLSLLHESRSPATMAGRLSRALGQVLIDENIVVTAASR